MKTSRAFFVNILYGFASWLRWLAHGRNQQFIKGNSHKLPQRSDTLANIKIEWLITYGIKGIILDLDNTIISEDDRYISPGAENWIEQAKLAGLVFFILSNGKRRYRVKYWSDRLKIQAIDSARKPFPMAFKTAIARMNLDPSQVVVIGDSVHTDIVGAWILGSCHIQVATLPHPPHWWENLAGKWVQTPYPSTTELWDFEDVYSDE